MNNKVFNELEVRLEKEGKSSGTVKEYNANLMRLEKFFPNKELSKLTQKDINKYAEYVSEKYSGTTYNSRMAVIRYVYKNIIKSDVDINKIPLKRVIK